jgi:hypothetical protein
MSAAYGAATLNLPEFFADGARDSLEVVADTILGPVRMIALPAFVAQGVGHEEIVKAGQPEENEIICSIAADLR